MSAVDHFLVELEHEQNIAKLRAERLQQQHEAADARGEAAAVTSLLVEMAVAAGEFMALERAMIIYRRVNQNETN